MSSDPDNKSLFAERLKEARSQRGLSQAELADKAGLVQSAIGHFEGARRRPSFANVRALARALNVSSDYLLGNASGMEGATTRFRGEENLSDADRDWIQTLIDVKLAEAKKNVPK